MTRSLSLYIISYLILIFISFVTFVVFKPFQYIDNLGSYIICMKDNSRFEIGPNLIYTFTNRLDEFNDKKARKLCEYGLVKDYIDSLKTPDKQNYTFYLVYTTESSWIDAIAISFIMFLVGVIIIEIAVNFFLGSAVFGKHLINFFMSLIN